MNFTSFEHNKFIQSLDKHKVEYLLVAPGGKELSEGAHADLWVKPTERNKNKLIKAINSYGFDGTKLKLKSFPQYALANDITIPLKNPIKIRSDYSNTHSFDEIKHKAQIAKGRNNYELKFVPSSQFEKSVAKSHEVKSTKNIAESKKLDKLSKINPVSEIKTRRR